MGNILLEPHHQSILCSIPLTVMQAIQNVGFNVAPENVQCESPWHYLGWRITQQTIRPQLLTLCVKDTPTLNELQKLVPWIGCVLSWVYLQNFYKPLSDLLRGNPHLYLFLQLTPEVKTALVHCAQALENQQNWRWDSDKSVYVTIIDRKCQPFAVQFQWFVNEEDHFHVLEWLFLPYTTRTVWTVY